ECLPLAVDVLEEQYLDAAAGCLAEVQSGGKHTRLVDDKEITLVEELRKLGHTPMRDCTAFVGGHQQAGGVPRFDRRLGNGRRRQVVVVGAHHERLRGYGETG